MPSIFKLLFFEIIHPFFVFQIFSVVLWYYDEYYLYSNVIIILTILSLSNNLYETIKNMRRIKKLAHFETKIKVVR